MAAGGSRRLAELDAVRGAIMVAMALDHASFFIARIHPFEFWSSPLPHYASPLMFLTRWITHFCAPGFFLIMGAGMALFAHSRRNLGWSEWRIARHHILRGLLLIPVSYLLEGIAWMLPSLAGGQPQEMPGAGQPAYVVLMVLVTLGLTMALCGLFLRFGWKFWVPLGLLGVLSPNVLLPAQDSGVSILMRVLVAPGVTQPVMSAYPILPWLGITALGIVLGNALLTMREEITRKALWKGLGAVGLYLVVRAAGGWGNIRLAEGGDWVAWMTVVKYPPSLAFVLLTLGVNAILLSVFARGWLGERIAGFFTVYGKAPLFFYLAHLYLYSLMRTPIFHGEAAPPLWVFYTGWAVGVALLYPACQWYSRFKHSRPAESVWRMF
jgi:uncharacterized membrane protein